VRSAQDLQNDLHSVQALLQQGTFLSLSGEEKERLLEDSLKLVRKLEAVAESSLVVGLLGGTGVGKSSLMNALAGAPIASTSHRRPHTDQVLIYHHAAMPLPDAITSSSQPRREITHEADPVRHILLCDLPDFDSLLTGHREQVLQFLEQLDILIWVTSPEKYADERFYTFLREVPKARQNFYFVLNKVDLLFPDGEPGTGHSQLSTVMARFSQHLRDNGVDQPIIFTVSAREGGEAGTASPWNHLWNFHNQIFRLRDAKELTEIKAANLDVEVKQLTEVLEKEVLGLSILHGVLKDAVSELEIRRPEWSRMGQDAFARALALNAKELLPQPAPEEALVGIGHGIAASVKDWKRLTDRFDKPEKGTVDLLLGQAAVQTLQQELERVEHRMTYQALHRGLPAAMGDHPSSLFDAASKWQELLQRWQEVVAQSLENDWAPSFRGFRTIQYAAYMALLGCLLVALSGDAGLASLFDHPSWYGLIGLAATLIQTLFSPRGFAALGSFLLLQIFLGFRFYRRYQTLWQRHAQKLVESFKLILENIWEEELTTLIDELTQNAEQVDARIAVLRALRSSSPQEPSKNNSHPF
jgi:hypothetical protein